MSDEKHARHSSNGLDEAKSLQDFVRQARDIVFLPRGAALFQEGEPCRGAYFVDTGELELTITSGGRRLKVGVATPGNLLAISSVLTDCDHQYSATAACDSRLIFLPSNGLREHLGKNAETCLLTVRSLGADLLDLSSNAIRPLRLQSKYHRPQ